MNKKGDKIISVYWFAILFIVAAAVAYMAIIFYGQPKDIRDMEENVLTNHIADCFAQGGYLKEGVLENEGFKENFLEECNLNFNVEDIYDWKEQEQYYVEVNFYEFDQDSVDSVGEEVFTIVEGNVNLKTSFILERAEEQGGNKEVVVLHYTAGGSAEGAIETLRDRGLSIHYVVDKDGTVISRDNIDSLDIEKGYKAFREEDRMAQHAGCKEAESREWRDTCSEVCVTDSGLLEQECSSNVENPLEKCCIRGFNQKSIGIEIVNLGNEEYPESQIDALVNLVSSIVSRNNIPVDRNHIIGHEEITTVKSDPGSKFPWEDFIERVNLKEYNPSARNFYVLDNFGNQYVIKILTVVGKLEKNVA